MPPSDRVKRQRDVLIEISQRHYDKRERLSLNEVKKAAAPVYVQYRKTLKSFTRDLNVLLRADLLDQNDSGFMPKIDPILERLPFTKNSK